MALKLVCAVTILARAAISAPRNESDSTCGGPSGQAEGICTHAGSAKSKSLLQASKDRCYRYTGGELTTSMLENWSMKGINADWTTRILPKPHKTAARLMPFTMAPVPPTGALEVKLALLFFIKDEMTPLWEDWAREAANAGFRFKILIHAYGIDHPDNFTNQYFKPSLVHGQSKTSWCQLWPAQMLLLREALKDPDISHLATLSDDSIPLKPLSFIQRELARDPASRFCGAPNARAETWWLLDRSHAELFHDYKELIDEALVSEASCSEESAWFFPLLLRKTRLKSAMPLLSECVMFTDWTCAGRELDMPKDHLLLQILHKESHTKASFGHPTTFHHLGPGAWKALNASKYWWGRKFRKASSDSSSNKYFL